MGHFRDRRDEKWGRSRPTPCFGPALFFAASFASICFPSASPSLRVTPKQNGPLNAFRCTPFTLICRP
jgi:hypothetical protein